MQHTDWRGSKLVAAIVPGEFWRAASALRVSDGAADYVAKDAWLELKTGVGTAPESPSAFVATITSRRCGDGR